MIGLLIATLLLLLLSLLLFSLRQKHPKNYPPGPPGIPLFGNAIQLGRQPNKTAQKMAETYGPILGLTTGSYRMVILHDAEDIREALGKSEFTGKFGYNPIVDQNHGFANEGLIFSEDHTWMVNRRFTLRTLRDFGLGRRSAESIILQEVEELLGKCRKMQNTPISTDTLFNPPIFNVLWHLVAGRRFSHGDPQLNQLIKLYHDFSDDIIGFRMFFFVFSWLVDLKNRFPFFFPQAHKRLLIQLWTFFDETIEEHRKTGEIENPRDFIDVALKEFQTAEDSAETTVTKDDLALKFILLDLFLAGTDTTSFTLVWSAFLLALHPEVQEKLFQEIQFVAGSRPVTLADRPSMPFAEAVMAETMRVASLVPNNVPRSTTADVTFKSFFIPKDTIVLTNLWAVHHNKKIWGDPENFRPTRFLTNDGKTFVKNKNLMPFSYGKRVCIGQLLARDEFFLFLMNLVANLKIVFPLDEPSHSMESLPGSLAVPEPHRITFQNRAGQIGR